MTGRDPSGGSLGFHQLLFTIEEITDGYAYGTDQFQVNRKIPIGVQRAKGATPLAGEQWLITKDLGPWVFAAIMNNPATTLVSEVHAGDGIAVDNDDPTNPIVTNTGVYEVHAGDNVTVDNTDPHNPVVSATSLEGQLPFYTSPGAGIGLTDTSTEGITIEEEGSGGINFILTDGSATFLVDAIHGADITLQTQSDTDSTIIITGLGSGGAVLSGTGVQVGSSASGALLNFFNAPSAGVVQQTVTGVRSNPEAALASLLTALANYGLIINDTTA